MSIALAARRALPLAMDRWPRLLVLYGIVFPPAAAATAVAFWPMWQHHPVLALGNGLLSLALLAVGILLLDEPAQQSPAVMLIASSALLTAGWLDNWHVGPLPLISVPASPLGIVLASWAIFRYPNAPHEVRVGIRFFALILVWLGVGELACIVVARPAWAGFPATTWWPTLLPEHAVYLAFSAIVDVGGAIFAVAYVFLWLRRWRRSRGISRRLAVPVAVAASVSCAATIVELIAAALQVGVPTLERIYTVESYLQISVPLAFLVSVLRRRFARTRVVELLLHLRGPVRASSVTDALRSVLEDPDLEVIDCALGTWVADELTDPQVDEGGRLRLPITSSSGELLALIRADPSLSANDELVQAAVAASSFALENARLDAALREQLQEVRASRLRIIEAGITERRKLERDLHDGTQQRLLALKIMLAAAEEDLGNDGARAIIGRIRVELGSVLDELRDLAHGIHPAALSQVGLEQAVRSMAERHAVPIEVSFPPGSFGDAAELTAYYLIAESVANAIKHARATRITVRGEKSGGYLQVTVTDDGRGGASAAAGTGISGLIDRVRGIGGELELASPAGLGTTLRAQIPCA